MTKDRGEDRAPGGREPELQWAQDLADRVLRKGWPVLVLALAYVLYRGYVTAGK